MNDEYKGLIDFAHEKYAPFASQREKYRLDVECLPDGAERVVCE